MNVMFPNLILGSPGSTVKSYVKTMSHPPCDDKCLFFTFSGGGATVGSVSGPSMVTSYSLHNGGSRFLSKNLILNVQTLLPRFDYIHQCIAFILELYKNARNLPN